MQIVKQDYEISYLLYACITLVPMNTMGGSPGEVSENPVT